MGYNSTFFGYLSPKGKIPESAISEINGLGLSVRVNTDSDDWDIGAIVPDSAEMHGYDIEKDVFRVVRLLKERGVAVSGCIYRYGDDLDDYERITVRGGRVFTAQGVVRYCNNREITENDVSLYAVRVVERDKGHKPGDYERFVGWIMRSPDTGKFRVLGASKHHDTVPPPISLAIFGSKEEAELAIHRAEKNLDGYEAEIVKWEDRQ